MTVGEATVVEEVEGAIVVDVEEDGWVGDDDVVA